MIPIDRSQRENSEYMLLFDNSNQMVFFHFIDYRLHDDNKKLE